MKLEDFRKVQFLPEWMSHEEVVQLAWHYEKVEESKGRYRVRPYGDGSYCVLDDIHDELWHTQRTSRSSRRIWTSRELTHAIEFCTQLNRDLPRVTPPISDTQRIAFINAAKRKRQQNTAIASFTKCGVCHRMVKRRCVHDTTD